MSDGTPQKIERDLDWHTHHVVFTNGIKGKSSQHRVIDDLIDLAVAVVNDAYTYEDDDHATTVRCELIDGLRSALTGCEPAFAREPQRFCADTVCGTGIQDRKTKLTFFVGQSSETSAFRNELLAALNYLATSDDLLHQIVGNADGKKEAHAARDANAVHDFRDMRDEAIDEARRHLANPKEGKRNG